MPTSLFKHPEPCNYIDLCTFKL